VWAFPGAAGYTPNPILQLLHQPAEGAWVSRIYERYSPSQISRMNRRFLKWLLASRFLVLISMNDYLFSMPP
jgi:hypothetical protein